MQMQEDLREFAWCLNTSFRFTVARLGGDNQRSNPSRANNCRTSQPAFDGFAKTPLAALHKKEGFPASLQTDAGGGEMWHLLFEDI